jgi:signal transduction histidine kinase
MAEEKIETNGFDLIPFRMHPRVFAALGADLVTNDVVAVIELVKNSYDAFADNAWVRFCHDDERGSYLEIEDDGQGMTKATIDDVWCLVATPFKENNPIARKGRKVRRVAGEKGLGRLAMARLGTQLQLITKSASDDPWEVKVDWSDIASESDITACYAQRRKYVGELPFVTPKVRPRVKSKAISKTGTILRIYNLNTSWDEPKITDLEENLARLLSPFFSQADFNIFLNRLDQPEAEEVRVESPKFLSKPKYQVEGDVDRKGNISAQYRFSPIKEGKPRSKSIDLSWGQVYDSIQDRDRFPFEASKTHCGPFSFDVRAWDIAGEDTEEIAEKFRFQRSNVRKAIRAHKGVSVYRDRILVLPKSENARDWLGLDLRRVSKVGTRLSTSQIVGYVSITAKGNPLIEDTSDRERLTSNREVAEFEELLKSIVSLLENERDQDRTKRGRETPLEDLFGSLSAEEMVAEMIALAEEGAEVSEAVPILQAFSSKLDEARNAIQERFVYYSRLATVGTIAQMLVHEIRNRTTSFGAFLEFVKKRYGSSKDKYFEAEYRSADNSVSALERLAETFSPLASRTFRRRLHESWLEERIQDCLALQAGAIKQKNIACHVPDSRTHVAVDPGELDAILLNLISNSVYWLSQVPADQREIEFRISHIDKGKRIRVWVHDSGPGVDEEDIEKVFWPGITHKPGGIGMGLTVASELVAEYGGRMVAKQPGTKGGASFAFDLPLKK